MFSTLTLTDLHAHWRERIRLFTEVELQTGLMLDLRRALEALEQRRTSVVLRWVDLVEERLLEVWNRYERTPLVSDEVTAETVLGHRFLDHGVEGWLDVLAGLREKAGGATVSRSTLLEEALEAQRNLLAVQRIAESSEEPLHRFLSAWGN
ncbi:MAG: hypothetical protein WC314_13890 [Vulcanimicrobiota bacterium]